MPARTNKATATIGTTTATAIFPLLLSPPLPAPLSPGLIAAPPVVDEGPAGFVSDKGGGGGAVTVVILVSVVRPFPLSVVTVVELIVVLRLVVVVDDVVGVLEVVVDDVVLSVVGSEVGGGCWVEVGGKLTLVGGSEVTEGTGGVVLVGAVVREVVGAEGVSCVGGTPVLVELEAIVKT